MAKKKAKSKEKSGAETKAPRLYRDAMTGRFVTKKYARKNPKSTVKERRSLAARADGRKLCGVGKRLATSLRRHPMDTALSP
jgi:hypothetical protein